VTRALPLTPLTRSGALSFENGGQSSKRGVGCPQPADYPAPIRRRQTRPGINNSTAPGAQLITIAAGDRFAPSKDNGSPPTPDCDER
jgi:hypothetical protein